MFEKVSAVGSTHLSTRDLDFPDSRTSRGRQFSGTAITVSCNIIQNTYIYIYICVQSGHRIRFCRIDFRG